MWDHMTYEDMLTKSEIRIENILPILMFHKLTWKFAFTSASLPETNISLSDFCNSSSQYKLYTSARLFNELMLDHP